MELSATLDPILLDLAVRENRIVLSHDVSTMVGYAYDRVKAGQPMPGLFEVSRQVPLGEAIEDLLLLALCSLEGEWEGQVLYRPPCGSRCGPVSLSCARSKPEPEPPEQPLPPTAVD